MADLETIAKLATIAAPLTKGIVETFIIPKVSELGKKWKRDKRLTEHFFENKFDEYLIRSYEKNSTLNTIVFHNRQQLLKDLYTPLEIMQIEDEEIKFKIEEYDESLIPVYKKILITDTAGMGKSTIIKRLFLSIIESTKGIPIIIELRRLTKERGIIEEILMQLNAINEKIDSQFILDLIKRGDFIFLFDGFDEIPIDERKNITNEIQSFISKAGNNYYVLTSRPEGALTSFGDFTEFRIKPLSPDEAFSLIRKYNPKGDISELLIKKISESHLASVKEFLTNPLLVSLLYTAFEYKHAIPFKKHIFYRQVYDAIFESHDLTKGDSYQRDKFCKLDIDDFHKILRYIGYKCLENNKIEFTKDELLALLEDTSLYLSEIKFKPSDFLKDLIGTVPLFTIDGIYYKWSHKSLQEYFAAQFILLDSKEKQKQILLALYSHKNNERFINLFDLFYSMDYKTFRDVIIFQIITDFVLYCDKSYKYLPPEIRTQRQLLTFGCDYIVVKMKMLNNDATDHSKVFKLLDVEILHKKSYSMPIVSNSFYKENDDIIVLYNRKPIQAIIDFLSKKTNENWVGPFNKPKKINQVVKLDIPENTPYHLVNRKNSILCNETNAQNINTIIIRYDRVGKIIYMEKALSLLKEIKMSKSYSGKKDSLLNIL